ncbi:MAG: hypothetical protein HYR51_19765 [Candidatus Rokubacteria bacterium]|nr:hypothetical protein [Candidatus Rokubacteria bacterium]
MLNEVRPKTDEEKELKRAFLRMLEDADVREALKLALAAADVASPKDNRRLFI